jgi:hypothetical protein
MISLYEVCTAEHMLCLQFGIFAMMDFRRVLLVGSSLILNLYIVMSHQREAWAGVRYVCVSS